MEKEIKRLKHEAQKSHVEYLAMKKDRKIRKVLYHLYNIIAITITINIIIITVIEHDSRI